MLAQYFMEKVDFKCTSQTEECSQRFAVNCVSFSVKISFRNIDKSILTIFSLSLVFAPRITKLPSSSSRSLLLIVCTSILRSFLILAVPSVVMVSNLVLRKDKSSVFGPERRENTNKYRGTSIAWTESPFILWKTDKFEAI